jgi:cofilin
MEALQTCKDALDGGLIGPTDYDRVKDAWLRAQSLKAAFDAGFMEERDYDKVKLEFLASLGATLSGGITAAPKSNGHHHHHHHQVPSTVAPAAPPLQAGAGSISTTRNTNDNMTKAKRFVVPSLATSIFSTPVSDPRGLRPDVPSATAS